MQAPIIMMSQNRAAEKDRLRAEQDFKVNLRSELMRRSPSRDEQLERLASYPRQEVAFTATSGTAAHWGRAQ